MEVPPFEFRTFYFLPGFAFSALLFQGASETYIILGVLFGLIGLMSGIYRSLNDSLQAIAQAQRQHRALLQSLTSEEDVLPDIDSYSESVTPNFSDTRSQSPPTTSACQEVSLDDDSVQIEVLEDDEYLRLFPDPTDTPILNRLLAQVQNQEAPSQEKQSQIYDKHPVKKENNRRIPVLLHGKPQVIKTEHRRSLEARKRRNKASKRRTKQRLHFQRVRRRLGRQPDIFPTPLQPPDLGLF